MKITIKSNQESVTMKLEGRLAGAFVNEVNQQWHKQLCELGSKKLVIDLCDLTFADAAGRQLLAEIYKKTGNEFLSLNPFTRYLANDAMQSKMQNSAQPLSRSEKREGAK